MNMIQIDMPEKCRYMSDYDRLLKGILPIDRKFILNKTITGCGGTSMFINSSLPVVIISPRIQVLKEKHKQHPDTFLFHIPLCNDRAEAIREEMQDLGVFHSLGALWLRVLNELETKGQKPFIPTMQANAQRSGSCCI